MIKNVLFLIMVIKAILTVSALKNSTNLEYEINHVPINYSSIINGHDFKFLLNPDKALCNTHGKLLVLVYVHSAPENLKRRISIRETWAKQSYFKETDMKMVFMLGVSKNSYAKTQRLLELEHSIYGDLVQEDFEDSYKNLTYKGIMSLKWISMYCSQTKYVLKVDDDIIVNTFTLLRHLKSLNSHQVTRNKQKTIMCLVWSKMVVQREKDQKWYLTYDEYKYDYFGKYCSGSAFLFTSDLASLMYNASFYVKFLWIDDYYISGMLARACNASYESINSLYIVNRNLVEQQFLGKKSFYSIFGHMPISINKVYSIWDYIVKKEIQSNFKKKISREFRWDDSIWLNFLQDNTNNMQETKTNLIDDFSLNENY